MSIEVCWAWDPAEEPGERPLGDRAIEACAQAALDHGGRPGLSLGIVLVDDRALEAMHGEWLGDPTPTDVITFDLSEGGAPKMGDGAAGPDGELYVSVDRALRVSRERGVSPGRELALYVVHGCLHLCGFDDHEPSERRRMRVAEARVLDALGYEPDFDPDA